MAGRVIMHIDMNAYYASVEQAANPEYRGKPVMVVMGPRVGIVATASYEARAYGIKTAMPVTEAKMLCPKGIFVPARLSLYIQISQEIFRIYQKYSPLVEYYSVDEAFVDYTGCEKLLGHPEDMAIKIKDDIRRTFNITCSVLFWITNNISDGFWGWYFISRINVYLFIIITGIVFIIIMCMYKIKIILLILLIFIHFIHLIFGIEHT